MTFFTDPGQFDPERDGKVPLRRTPLHLAVRAVTQATRMLFSRHPQDLPRWGWSMLRRSQPLSYGLPWLTFGAIRELQRRVRPRQRVFEFGSGHSTLFWSRHGVELHSVEDDPGWFSLIEKRLGGAPGVNLYFEPTQEGYVGRLAATPGQFDVVVVDGSHRLACLSAAVDRVAPGGLLVVDNTDWHWFSKVDEMVPSGWQKQVHSGSAPFIGHPSQTSIWVRP